MQAFELCDGTGQVFCTAEPRALPGLTVRPALTALTCTHMLLHALSLLYNCQHRPVASMVTVHGDRTARCKHTRCSYKQCRLQQAAATLCMHTPAHVLRPAAAASRRTSPGPGRCAAAAACTVLLPSSKDAGPRSVTLPTPRPAGYVNTGCLQIWKATALLMGQRIKHTLLCAHFEAACVQCKRVLRCSAAAATATAAALALLPCVHTKTPSMNADHIKMLVVNCFACMPAVSPCS
jgi:hypothetical protein